MEAQVAAQEKEEQEAEIELEKIARNLENQKFEFTVKTGEKGEVFGSVGKDDIKTRIGIKDIKVNLKGRFKTLGEHRVEIDLGKE